MGLVVFWLAIAIFTFIIDVLSSNFCFVLFSIGAIVSAICAALVLAFMIQIIVFAIISIIAVSIGYPILKKKNICMCKKTLRMEETYS